MKSSCWQKVSLGDVCDVIAGGTPSRKNPKYFGDDIPWVKISDMLQGLITFTDEAITKAGLENSTAKILPSGTVLISIFATIGRTAVLGIDAATNQAIVGVIPKPETKLNASFLRYSLDNSILELTKEARGVAQVNINGKILKSLKIPLPPLPEQEQIVRLLDEAESIRATRERANVRMDQFVPALFQEMFGDPAINKNQWNLVSLTDVCDGKYGIKAGPFGSSIKKETYKPSGYKVYGQEQVIADDFNIGNYFIDESKFQELKSCEVKPGDVLISLVGTIGKISIVPDGIKPGIINPRLLKLTPNQNLITPTFLKFLLENSSIQNILYHLAGGITMGVLNAGILKKLSFPLPPLALQREFAARVEEVRGVQSAQGKSAERVEALYQSMLARAFAGEL